LIECELDHCLVGQGSAAGEHALELLVTEVFARSHERSLELRVT
jgi:hypothetical protein